MLNKPIISSKPLNLGIKRLMYIWKYFLVILSIPLLSFGPTHKYYVSLTKIDYIKEQQTVQITTKIFIEDFEKALRNRYEDTLVLDAGQNEEKIEIYLRKYLSSKLKIKINQAQQELIFLGKAYIEDQVVCYLEIANVANIEQFEVKNLVLFDVFQEQKNIVRTYINDKHQTVVLTPRNNTGLLAY